MQIAGIIFLTALIFTCIGFIWGVSRERQGKNKR